MGNSKTEINLRRLLAAAPHQQSQAKLIHYVSTLREQLEELGEEKTSEGLPRVSKVQVNDYSAKIEAIAAAFSLKNFQSTMQESEKPFVATSVKSPSKTQRESPILNYPKLRRRFVSQSNVEEGPDNSVDTDHSATVKLDAAAHTHIGKHRKLQEDLTDEMVGLAQQLKESSLMMHQSLKNAEKILDSTQRAVEHSLASTRRANTRAMEIYSKSFTTTCFTWLVIFVVTCIFVVVVLIIRVT